MSDLSGSPILESMDERKDNIIPIEDRDYNNHESDSGTNCCALVLKILSIFLILITFPISLFMCIKVVKEYERAIIFRLGRLGGAKGPGLFFIIPCMDNYRCIDIRQIINIHILHETISFNVPPQQILSKDSVTVTVDAVVYYRVFNPTITVCNVENYTYSTQLLAATSLRNILGTKSLADMLSDRESISRTLQTVLDEGTHPWGVKVERVEIKDVHLPVQMQRAMAAEAEASRDARAKVIAAEGEQRASRALKEAADVIASEGEQRASRALKEAADVISESPSALQLRYLQTLATIATEKNSTIVFP
ncbi:unnamed protein product, partial [Oppiella nova]